MEKYTRIKAVMREKGVTAAEVAKRMGISPGTLSGIINGNPTIGSLALVARILETGVQDLIREDA